MKQNNLDNTLSITCLLQVVLHKIDELSDATLYKRELKQRTNNYYNYIEKFVENVTSALPKESNQNYVDIVKEIENIANQIKITE